MFDRALVRLLIVLSIFAAAPLASAQEGGPAETVGMNELNGAEIDVVKADDAAGATVVVDDNASEKDADQKRDEAFEEGVDDFANETTPTGPLPDEVPIAMMPEEPLAFSASRSMTVISAVEDVYVNLVEEKVYDEDRLISEYLVGDRREDEEFLGMVMIQFNVSGLEFEEDDIAVLVLKAESMERADDEMAGVVLMPATSEWSESSSAAALALNMLPTVFMISDGDGSDFSTFGIDFGADEIFIFDVSEHLRAAEGGWVSFLLVAVGDANYRVSFKSRETGEGPRLLIVPYPSASAA
ncbi:hypothetical protein [Methanocrinis sp.]|uniref:hypothetical protein n=1 Tax=Methanocrinis sp. TaxID=3101522 RepID=UPI003D11D3E0